MIIEQYLEAISVLKIHRVVGILKKLRKYVMFDCFVADWPSFLITHVTFKSEAPG